MQISHSQCQAEVGFILSPSARTGLADLAPRAKVGQTVGCSTFTRGAKPATQRVADGERMNPREGWRVPANREDDEHQVDEHLEGVTSGWTDGNRMMRATAGDRQSNVRRGEPARQFPCPGKSHWPGWLALAFALALIGAQDSGR